MKKIIFSSLVLIVFIFKGEAQVADLARIEYTYFPQDQSDNSFKRFRSFVHFPIMFGESAYLVPGFEYRNVNLKLRDPFPFNTNNRERYESFTVTLGFTDMMNNDWRYAFKGGLKLASDFEGKPIKDDYIYEASVFLIKDKTGDNEANPPKKPWRLVVGINYSTTVGRPFPLPIINYYREFQPQWSYTLGIPKSNLKYAFNSKNSIQAFATLDGFFANIQNNINVPNEGMGENISMTTVLSGLGYEYGLSKHLYLYAYFGHTIINDIRLRDGKGNDVYTINNQNNFYGRTGLKFKI
ncbi:hypothetical protein KXJ69_00200 [Aureisphaera sp. CAU 1614]|uniref:DUF6268 domain-containing protein n=1 Tax=Halomarinibacterium sedimenti TaxID=2857106 RepID=A0A9X1FLJ8_9FLAO|nr:DUF6268 family outer membrane beta-barrel protein [Halomarinibacterium sedimenti]MBW2936503.1 hypothetical protein [Halomarinibacterium sedimenti]